MFSPQKCFDAQIWNSAATSDTQIQILGCSNLCSQIQVVFSKCDVIYCHCVRFNDLLSLFALQVKCPTKLPTRREGVSARVPLLASRWAWWPSSSSSSLSSASSSVGRWHSRRRKKCASYSPASLLQVTINSNIVTWSVVEQIKIYLLHRKWLKRKTTAVYGFKPFANII